MLNLGTFICLFPAWIVLKLYTCIHKLTSARLWRLSCLLPVPILVTCSILFFVRHSSSKCDTGMRTSAKIICPPPPDKNSEFAKMLYSLLSKQVHANSTPPYPTLYKKKGTVTVLILAQKHRLQVLVKTHQYGGFTEHNMIL